MSAPLSRREPWLAFGLVTTLTLGIGLRARLVELMVNWDGLVAVAHAYDVYYAEPAANLAMIGFVQPPLPALLQLPLVLALPGLASTGLAANLMGALAVGIAAALLLGLAAEAGLPPSWRRPLVGVFALHPLVLGPAATGAPLAILIALLMGASWALARWGQNENLRDLIAASLALAGAVITRYETIFIVAGALVYLAWRTRRGGGSLAKLEGTLITFALPIVYVGGIWVAANWAIMGDPWYFAREIFAPAAASAPGVSAEAMLSASLRVGLVCFFPVLALVYHQMRGVARYPAPARPVAWLVLVAMAAPVLFPAAFAGFAGDDWGRLESVIAMVIAGGFAMLAVVIGDLRRGCADGPLQGTILVAVSSLVVVLWLAGQGLALPGRFDDAYFGRGPLADSAEPVLRAAALLRETPLAEGHEHIIVGWPGFAVVLFAGRTGELTVMRTQDLPEVVDNLWVGSTVVLLVGEDVGGLPEAIVDANLGLRPELALRERWAAGSWHCYEVVMRPPPGAAP